MNGGSSAQFRHVSLVIYGRLFVWLPARTRLHCGVFQRRSTATRTCTCRQRTLAARATSVFISAPTDPTGCYCWQPVRMACDVIALFLQPLAVMFTTNYTVIRRISLDRKKDVDYGKWLSSNRHVGPCW